MKKVNDKLHYSRMGVRHRQRIVEVGGKGPMTQDRVKCPFCSELILRDAIKCRFCGEWLSMPDQDVGVGRPADDNAPATGDQESDRVALVEIQKRLVPMEAVQHADRDVQDAGQDQNSERIRHVEQSPVRVAREIIPGQGLDAGLITKRRRIPWARVLLLILYLGIAAAMVVFELRAREILSDAAAKEKAQDPNAAFAMYGEIRDSFPFSFATIEARQGLLRICQSPDRQMPKPSWLLRVGDLFGGKDADLPDVYLLPFVAWPVSAVLLLLVFLTRIFRPGAALLALLLMILAIAGSAAQFAWYGLIPLAPVVEATQDFMQTPVAVYSASYMLLAMTALMTLTAATKRRNPQLTRIAPAAARRR